MINEGESTSGNALADKGDRKRYIGALYVNTEQDDGDYITWMKNIRKLITELRTSVEISESTEQIKNIDKRTLDISQKYWEEGVLDQADKNQVLGLIIGHTILDRLSVMVVKRYGTVSFNTYQNILKSQNAQRKEVQEQSL